jgi:hypothetical protein
MKKTTILLFAAGILLHAHCALAQTDRVLYEAPYRLTQSMLDQHALLVQTLLDLRYSPAQKQKHADLVEQYWRKNDVRGMQAVLGNLQFFEEIRQKPSEEQKAFIRQIRSALILNLIDDSKKQEDSRWYLENYFSVHQPLHASGIPLLRETADDLIEFEFFKNKVLKHQPAREITAAQRDSAHRQLAEVWKTMTDGQRRDVMSGASHLALIQYRWKHLDGPSKTGIRLRYVGRAFVSDAEYRQYQQSIATVSQHQGSDQWQLVQNELNFMKKSTDIIMSRGTRWNPSANRYEQEGGVVTEFW